MFGLCCLLQLAGGLILGVALWLRHDPQTSNLLQLEFDGAQAPNTFYIGMFLIVELLLSQLSFSYLQITENSSPSSIFH